MNRREKWDVHNSYSLDELGRVNDIIERKFLETKKRAEHTIATTPEERVNKQKASRENAANVRAKALEYADFLNKNYNILLNKIELTTNEMIEKGNFSAEKVLANYEKELKDFKEKSEFVDAVKNNFHEPITTQLQYKFLMADLAKFNNHFVVFVPKELFPFQKFSLDNLSDEEKLIIKQKIEKSNTFKEGISTAVHYTKYFPEYVNKLNISDAGKIIAKHPECYPLVQNNVFAGSTDDVVVKRLNEYIIASDGEVLKYFTKKEFGYIQHLDSIGRIIFKNPDCINYIPNKYLTDIYTIKKVFNTRKSKIYITLGSKLDNYPELKEFALSWNRTKLDLPQNTINV